MSKLLDFFSAFADKSNLFWGAISASLAVIFGDHWYIFAFFAALNVIDYIYGLLKAKKTGTINSSKGAFGIFKKMSYWVIIGIAFAISFIFEDFGAKIGVDLSFLRLLGWFTLSVYIINELTSIVENLIVLGVSVPDVFLRALSVARTTVDDAGKKVIPAPVEDKHD